MKSLVDMVFPNPPENAGQARGYVNQVLMSIGKLQKTPGNEVYQWAQECLTTDEAVLQADPRYPRTDREIASRLTKTCKCGRFGLVFQKQSPQPAVQCHAGARCYVKYSNISNWSVTA